MTVNAICPAMVKTNLPPPDLQFPPEHETPMSTVLRAYDELLLDEARVERAAEFVGAVHLQDLELAGLVVDLDIDDHRRMGASRSRQRRKGEGEGEEVGCLW